MSSPFIRSSLSRLAASWLPGLALILGLVASGDRSVWSAGPGNAGIDPLEILNLAVRPNAIFVLGMKVSGFSRYLNNTSSVHTRPLAPAALLASE